MEYEYDYPNVFEFMQLLKKHNYNRNELFVPILNKKQIRVVKQVKKKSTLFIFHLDHMLYINVLLEVRK